MARRSTAFSPPPGRRRHRALHRRVAHEDPDDDPHPAPADGQARGPVQLRARRFHRAEAIQAAARITSAPSRSPPGLGVDRDGPRLRGGPRRLQFHLTKALADRLAEASAEWLHRQARIAWGFGAGRKTQQRGPDQGKVPRHSPRARLSRPAPTTPRSACSSTCFRPRRTRSVVLTENFAMHPASSRSAAFTSPILTRNISASA